MIVHVDSVRRQPGTVWLGYGVDERTGRHVAFAGDARMLRAIQAAIAAGEDDTEVEVESWQVLS